MGCTQLGMPWVPAFGAFWKLVSNSQHRLCGAKPVNGVLSGLTACDSAAAHRDSLHMLSCTATGFLPLRHLGLQPVQ